MSRLSYISLVCHFYFYNRTVHSVCIIFYNTSLPCLLCIAAFISSLPKIARYSMLLMGRSRKTTVSVIQIQMRCLI